ncbi:AraC family transcriptional regulator [Streptomyces sp. HNM0645]|uniref:AraC family transcriptional regulator n=1 Tax=Streptomyces sp. HNM0645 TaxID=2782343 RepID=UPI0024B80A0F|nr:AraC family transcriptional regulator [Streptomyces sp. HNM0645]MDI9887688.1 AraC family transcriptional regulator [Streptomyces sp. HNM0645]
MVRRGRLPGRHHRHGVPRAPGGRGRTGLRTAARQPPARPGAGPPARAVEGRRPSGGRSGRRRPGQRHDRAGPGPADLGGAPRGRPAGPFGHGRVTGRARDGLRPPPPHRCGTDTGPHSPGARRVPQAAVRGPRTRRHQPGAVRHHRAAGDGPRPAGLPPPCRAARVGVAARCGFASPSHFARRFRAAYGVTPREWRTLRAREAASSSSPGA